VNASLFEQAIAEAIGGGRLQAGAPLAPLTTFRLGGPADWLVSVHSAGELVAVVQTARRAGVPVTILGGGSNVIVSDRGVRGLVVRPQLTGIEQTAPDRVRAEGGVTVNGLVRWTVGRGLGSLEAWAGTPGTVGGAIFGNAHFGGRNIGDLVRDVQLMTLVGDLLLVPAAEMAFAYDTSRLRATGEILVWAEFGAYPASSEALRQSARASLAYRKRTQPLALPSAGCIFQNPDPARDPIPAGVPASAGALIDRAGLKGTRVGGARFSAVHANFIVNEGGATARDVRTLVETARSSVRDRFGVELRDEVVFLGEFRESENQRIHES
jgi:UDP-N-acetylmuramate dehydrogenase